MRWHSVVGYYTLAKKHVAIFPLQSDADLGRMHADILPLSLSSN